MKGLYSIIISLAFWHSATGCTCGYKSFQEAYQQTDIILHGKVVSVYNAYQRFRVAEYAMIDGEYTESGDSITATMRVVLAEIEVISKLKNQDLFDKVYVLTDVDDASCGYNFTKGEEYIIYGYHTNVQYVYTRNPDLTILNLPGTLFSTNLCTRTTNRIKNELEHIAGVGK